MTKVTLHQNNISEDKKPINKNEALIEDAMGRAILIRKPPFSAQFNVIKWVGAELANNIPYVEHVCALHWLVSINGEIVSTPFSEREVNALTDRLDDYGYNALLKGILKIRGVSSDEEREAEQKNEIAVAKK
jgi:hypothetical protein